MIPWPLPWRWLAAAGLAVALAFAYFAWRDHQRDIGSDRERAKWEQAISMQKAEAARTLAAEKDKTAIAERALIEAKQRQEVQDAQNRTTVSALERRLRDAAGPAGRLRDPNAAGCGGSGSGASGEAASSTGNRAADTAETGGLLSVQLSDLLRQRLREADEINVAYASCRADALNLRSVNR